MESTYNDIIQEKSKNIGSLCFFLGRNKDVLDFIGENIPKEILDRTISERVYYYLNKMLPDGWDLVRKTHSIDINKKIKPSI